jgi:hypothetical protein
MKEPRYTATENLSGCYVKVGHQVHGLFIAKRVRPHQTSAAKWVRPEPRHEPRW